MSDRAEDLGAEQDRIFPPLKNIPQAESPWSESIDLNEYPLELLRMRKCRTFRADLLHKLTLILRAHGGYDRAGVERAAISLKISRWTLRRWMRWECAPRRLQQFARIDDEYSRALEKLVALKLRRMKK